jgi:hypothetical protein
MTDADFVEVQVVFRKAGRVSEGRSCFGRQVVFRKAGRVS